MDLCKLPCHLGSIVLPMRLSATHVLSTGSCVSSSQAPPTRMCVVLASSVATCVCGSLTAITSVLLRSLLLVRAAILFPLALLVPLVLLVSLVPLLWPTSSNCLGTLAWTLLALLMTYLLVVISTFPVLSQLAPPYSGAPRLLVPKATTWWPSSTCSLPGVCSASC
jgi:hypothetical protein